jgi:hypothetical protein
MSKEEAWEECEDALRTVCRDRCVGFECGCETMIEKIKGVLNV